MGEECLGHFSKIVERAWGKGVEPIQRRAFHAGRKSETYDQIIAGVDHHLIPKISDMLNRITHSEVVVESGS